LRAVKFKSFGRGNNYEDEKTRDLRILASKIAVWFSNYLNSVFYTCPVLVRMKGAWLIWIVMALSELGLDILFALRPTINQWAVSSVCHILPSSGKNAIFV